MAQDVEQSEEPEEEEGLAQKVETFRSCSRVRRGNRRSLGSRKGRWFSGTRTLIGSRESASGHCSHHGLFWA